jgi:hypothetical protein
MILADSNIIITPLQEISVGHPMFQYQCACRIGDQRFGSAWQSPLSSFFISPKQKRLPFFAGQPLLERIIFKCPAVLCSFHGAQRKDQRTLNDTPMPNPEKRDDVAASIRRIFGGSQISGGSSRFPELLPKRTAPAGVSNLLETAEKFLVHAAAADAVAQVKDQVFQAVRKFSAIHAQFATGGHRQALHPGRLFFGLIDDFQQFLARNRLRKLIQSRNRIRHRALQSKISVSANVKKGFRPTKLGNLTLTIPGQK